jgi:sugar diacid utilization regulator
MRALAPRRSERSRGPRELLELIRLADRTRRTRARIIVDQCLERLPRYRDLPDALLADVRRSVLHHLALFYRVTLEIGRSLTDADLEQSRQTARLRASQGVPLGEFLMFFQVGLTVIWEHLMEQARESPVLRAQLLDRVAPIFSNQTQLMTALTESYVEERVRLSRFREQDLDDFFRLLFAEDAMESVLEARARGLGIPLDEPRVVALFDPGASAGTDGPAVEPDDLRSLLASRLRQADPWVGRSREGFAALLAGDPDPASLAAVAGALFGDAGRVGTGGPARQVAGLRRSAREALRALRIAGTLRQAQRVHRYSDLAVLDLVGIGTPDAEEFMRRVLGPLALAGASRTTLETLRQLSASGYRIKRAAAALSVHPHTLSYRMKQIRTHFGIDLDDPEVRLRVHLALLILEARGPA